MAVAVAVLCVAAEHLGHPRPEDDAATLHAMHRHGAFSCGRKGGNRRCLIQAAPLVVRGRSGRAGLLTWQP